MRLVQTTAMVRPDQLMQLKHRLLDEKLSQGAWLREVIDLYLANKIKLSGRDKQ